MSDSDLSAADPFGQIADELVDAIRQPASSISRRTGGQYTIGRV
jgi:hypothetical protein